MTKRGSRFEPEAELRSVVVMDYTIDHHPPPPFRVLSPGGPPYGQPPAHQVLRSPPQPSSRAPEPYKLTTAQARSQRKSAFAIIAETPAATPAVLRASSSSPQSSSRPSSPSQQFPGADRLSPFRGRGFKGPPPRSRSQHLSRPHSPSDDLGEDERGRSRYHQQRRVSISQQSSPKRSQIPRPARSRSISSSKENLSRKSSPKFGRRAAPKAKVDSNNKSYTSSITSNNKANNRRTSLKDTQKRSDLSPIQGTPTKVLTDRNNKVATAKKVGQFRGTLAAAQRLGKPGAANKKPPILGGKRFITAESSESSSAQQERTTTATSDSLDSPSKIPRRNGVLSNANSASTTSLSKLSPTKTTVTASPGLRASKTNLANQPQAAKSSSSEKQTTDDTSKDTSASNQNGPPSSTDDEPGLVDLLKQSSGVTGTSSVVNTTTTTAVQPLHIDASSILHEGELVAKLTSLEKKQKSGEKSPDSQKSSAKGKSPRSQTDDVNSTASSVDQISSKTEANKGRDKEKDEHQNASNNSNHKKTDSKSSSIAKNSTKSTNSGADSSKKGSTSPRLNSAEADQARTGSSDSIGSIRSTDTGVSVNTVRGVSSAKEKSGLHVVKRTDEIETLSGNIVNHERNGDQALSGDLGIEGGVPATKWQRFKKDCLKRLNRVGVARSDRLGRVCGCLSCPGMRCLACKRDNPKGQLWPGSKAARTASTTQLTDKAPTKWDKFRNATCATCRCSKLRSWMHARKTKKQQLRQQRLAAAVRHEAPIPPSRNCCSAAGARMGAVCRSLWSKCKCTGCGWPCRRKSQARIGKNARSKPSLTSVQAPPVSEENRPKLPDVLIEHNSIMRGAIPCLPVPIAWLCLLCNFFVPGSGTVLSGVFNLCCGQPRFSATASPAARFGALVVNGIVGVSQLFTILFCFVGWGWSVWWGVTMLRLARKYKRFKESEAVSNDPEARGAGVETATLPAPGVPPLRAGGADARAAAR